jgi:small subunit ribosomal protein S1
MNRNRNNVVLSRRVVLEEDRKQERQEILNKLVKGMILPGTVSSIVDFGAFVDLGGIDGLVHISELSWSHVNHPSEVVSVGDAVEVQVLDVDLSRERISLGLKQTQDDPWKQLVREFQIGVIADGRVTKLVPFGAFVEIGNNVEGLVHISEMARGHVEKPEDVVAVGDEIKVKVMDVDMERRRISLSIRAANEELGLPDAVPDYDEDADEAGAEGIETDEAAEAVEADAEVMEPDMADEAVEPEVEEVAEAPEAAEPEGEEAVEIAEPEAEEAEEAAEPEAEEAEEAAEPEAEEAEEAAEPEAEEALEVSDDDDDDDDDDDEKKDDESTED